MDIQKGFNFISTLTRLVQWQIGAPLRFLTALSLERSGDGAFYLCRVQFDCGVVGEFPVIMSLDGAHRA